MFKQLAFVCILTGIGIQVKAQSTLWSTPEAYLHEAPPSDTPKPFAPGRLAEPGTFLMGRVAFSKDGKEFYYTQNDSWKSGEHAKLKEIRYAGDQWGKPTVVGEQLLSPTFSIDQTELYMRQGNMHNVWKAIRNGDRWTTPAKFLDEKFALYDFMPTLSGTYYIGSNADPDDLKHGITYAFSTLTISNGNLNVKSLGQPLNESGFNGDLYIAPDESYIIVSAKETPTFQSELYIAFRKPDRTWTTPVSLGPKINNGLAHRWGQYVSPDGKYLFYCQGTSEKDCAIYWVRFDKLLKELTPQYL